jgi:predicted AlkP superfamily phosphohydrolase/phosphomutase
MTSPPKVLFIGLDAAARPLILRWAHEGLLPNLNALFATGAHGTTRSAPAIYTGSVWPTIWTGAGPGSHGCYYNEQLRPGTYEVAEFTGRAVRRDPFWEALARAGRRVCLFDVPKAPLCEGLNGLQIVDWGTHDADVPACSWPPGLIGEVHARFGISGVRRCDWLMDGDGGEAVLHAQLQKRIETKVAIAEDLLRREAWDLFMVGFGDSHCAGHQLWHVHDPAHPKHDAAMRAALGDPLRNVYVALDKAVGRLLAHAGPETAVIVVCSHGMAAHYDASYLLDDILRRLEGRPAPAARTVLDGARRLWKRLPLRFTELFAPVATRVYRMPDADDRRHRRCFVVPSNANGPGIRLNLVGREPDGKLRPGAEAERFVASLVADLAELTEPADGRPLVKEVIRARDRFTGENAELLPDLFVRWHRDRPITGVASPKFAAIVEEDRTTRRTGDHRPGGLYFMRGPGVPAGTQFPEGRDEDFAPTIAALLGSELPGVEGTSVLAPHA